MTKYLRFAPLGVFFILALLLASGLLLPNKAELTRPAIIGSIIPDFNLPRLDSETAFLIPRTWRGQVSVLNFFASWCEPCRVEHPYLLALGRTPGVKLYGVAWKDDPEKARAYLAQYGNPYQAAASDLHGELTVSFGIAGVPETIVIDKQGVVRWKYSGPLTEDVIRTQLMPLIDQYAAQP